MASPAPRSPLTAHLHDVLVLLADGLTDAEIAEKMVIEQGTVRGCIQRICRSHGATGRGHVVALAFRRGDLR